MLVDIPQDVGQTTASELYGMLFNFGLMGTLVVQIHHYYVSFPTDKRTVRAIVYTLFTLELVQTGILSYFAYTIFGSGYGNLIVFDRSALEWFPVCILGALIAGIVQLYYAHRLYVFSGSVFAGGGVALLAFLQMGSGFAQGVISKLVTDRSSLGTKPVCVTIWLLSSAVCDIFIAISMTYYLKRHEVTSAKLNDVVSKIIGYTIGTGAITATVALVQVVVFLAFPHHNYFETPSWTLGKLYSNNLLVLLNARAGISSNNTSDSEFVRGIDFAHDPSTPVAEEKYITGSMGSVGSSGLRKEA